MFFGSFLRPLAALFFLTSLLGMPGCGGKSDPANPASETTVEVKGKVTYVRIPLRKDEAGRPLGLETDSTKFQTLPARGVRIRAVSSKEETKPDGTKVKIWSDASGLGYTDSEGAFSFRIPKGNPTFVEVQSMFGGGSGTRIVGDPAGIDSLLSVSERPVYCIRKGLDGSAPQGNPIPTSLPTTSVTLDFAIGLEDKWWLCPQPPTAAPDAVLETTGTGSRILAIGDTLYAFATTYGNPTPGRIQNLHYRLGLSHPRGTFVEYDPEAYPKSFESGSLTYFGSIRGGAENDDAFDPGVLHPLFSRNRLFAQGLVAQAPRGVLTPDLAPDMALIEGLSYAMAAIVQKSPFLADTIPGGVQIPVELGAAFVPATEGTPYSPKNLAVLAWELALKAQGLPFPGAPADWDKLDPAVLARFFALVNPKDSDSVAKDLPSIFGQLARLQEDKSSVETVDLKALFTDAVLTPLLVPYGLPWPRPTSGEFSGFMHDWGADPNTLAQPLAPLNFTMQGATQVEGHYPNLSHGEIHSARMKLTKDTAYQIRVIPSTGTLPAGAHLELRLASGAEAMAFTGAETSGTRVVLRGKSETPIWHFLQLRLVSPQAIVPDFQATVRLDVAP